MLDMKDKTILITGASGDIGMACAEILVQAGATLILHSHNNGNKINSFISCHGDSNIYHINCDATEEPDVEKQFKYLRDMGIKNIDVLVNNAGDLIERRKFVDMDWNLMSSAIDVNLKSAFIFTKNSLPFMLRGSSIIFISSLTARHGKGDRSIHYGTAKSAILGFSKCLANELGPEGIRVNSVAPGFIEGGFHERHTKPEVATEHMKKNPLKRNGTPDDVAGTVLFLASNSSQYINGITLDVCGGDFVC